MRIIEIDLSRGLLSESAASAVLTCRPGASLVNALTRSSSSLAETTKCTLVERRSLSEAASDLA
jgi:hypothetical protein